MTREQYRLLRDIPEIARDEKGQPLVSADVVVLVNVARRNNAGESHVLIRGISPRGLELRPQVSLVGGRWFRPGLREAVVTRRLAARFAHFDIGDQISIGTRKLAVVGWTDAGYYIELIDGNEYVGHRAKVCLQDIRRSYAVADVILPGAPVQAPGSGVVSPLFCGSPEFLQIFADWRK